MVKQVPCLKEPGNIDDSRVRMRSVPLKTDVIQLEEKMPTFIGEEVVFSLDKIHLSRGGSETIDSL